MASVSFKDGDERLLALTVGFQVARGAASFDPYARVEFVDAHSDGYSEVSRNPTGPGGGWDGAYLLGYDEAAKDPVTRAVAMHDAAVAHYRAGQKIELKPRAYSTWLEASRTSNR